MRRRPARCCCHPECRLKAEAACLPWRDGRPDSSGADDVEWREAALEDPLQGSQAFRERLEQLRMAPRPAAKLVRLIRCRASSKPSGALAASANDVVIIDGNQNPRTPRRKVAKTQRTEQE
jgi:hypothetical protein